MLFPGAVVGGGGGKKIENHAQTHETMMIDLGKREVKINMVETAIPLPMEKIAEFCQKWNLTELALFGSILRDDFNANSDVDVMVQFHHEAHPTLFDLAEMEEELKQIFQRDVDLITRKGIETSRNYLRRQAILSSAQVIYGTGYSIFACDAVSSQPPC